MSKTGKLILIPNFMHEEESCSVFSEAVALACKELDGCVVESEKKGRHLLKHFKYERVPSFRELSLYTLNEHNTSFKEILEIVKGGKNLGLVSDAGLSCLADPGADLVFQARRQGVKIEVVGVHSSLIYSLMASGLCQRAFYFVGYMPKQEAEFLEKLKKLEKLSKEEKTTIMFIETPYRNEVVLRQLKEGLSKDTFIAYCQNVGSPSEYIYLNSVGAFAIDPAKILKSPATFIFKA